jgi:hypothetical protein
MPEGHQWEAMMRPNHTFKHLIDEGFRPFRKDAVVWAKQMDEPFEVPTPAGPMHGEAGDYWCIGLRNQQWLSQAAVFEQIYKPVWHPAGSEAYLMNAAALPYLQAGYSSSIATATSHSADARDLSAPLFGAASTRSPPTAAL